MHIEATFEAVKAAMDELEGDGINPSLDAIKAITGGNKGTIGAAREAVRQWRAVQARSDQPADAADRRKEHDTLMAGVDRIVKPIAQTFADITPALVEHVKKEIDAERDANRHVVETVVADHKRAMDSQLRLNELESAAAAENAAALECCEAENATLKARVASQDVEISQLGADTEQLRAENITLSGEKYAAIDRAVALTDRISQMQTELGSVQERLNQTERQLIEARLKEESSALALDKAQDEVSARTMDCEKLAAQFDDLRTEYDKLFAQYDELRVRYARADEYAVTVSEVFKAVRAVPADRVEELYKKLGETIGQRSGYDT